VSALDWVWPWCLGVALAYWARVLYGVVRVAFLPKLGECTRPEPPAWPRLSVVVPVRDEVSEIGAAAASLLAQDYPDLELVLVDDRSTDGTAEVVDHLAASDSRVVAVHLSSLPPGWLGKVHAMQRGLERASGQLVLFTDADVHFAPCALREAVALVEADTLDHLAAIPRFRSSGLVVDAVLATALRSIVAVAFPPWRVSDPRSADFFGVGAFNLVRREALERTEGLAWLRLETVDDMALGLLLKSSGARCQVVSAFSELGLHWHRSVAQVASGMEKAWVGVDRCSLPRAAALTSMALLAEVSPLAGVAAALCGPGFVARALGLALVVVAASALLTYARWSGASSLAALAAPLAAPLSAAISARAAVLGLRRGGIAWRGTVYPCQELLRGVRVRLPI
jgi:hypothetical protein